MLRATLHARLLGHAAQHRLVVIVPPVSGTSSQQHEQGLMQILSVRCVVYLGRLYYYRRLLFVAAQANLFVGLLNVIEHGQRAHRIHSATLLQRNLQRIGGAC